jgi:hypothetical protein
MNIMKAMGKLEKINKMSYENTKGIVQISVLGSETEIPSNKYGSRIEVM